LVLGRPASQEDQTIERRSDEQVQPDRPAAHDRPQPGHQRNFDEAGVPDHVAEQVAARLADPAQVAASRQLPMRFLSAYRAAPSLRWAAALERAPAASLASALSSAAWFFSLRSIS